MRLPVVPQLSTKDGVSNKNARMTNMLKETRATGELAVVRPGLVTQAVSTGNGNGLVNFNGDLVSIFGATLGEVVVEPSGVLVASLGGFLDYTGSSAMTIGPTGEILGVYYEEGGDINGFTWTELDGVAVYTDAIGLFDEYYVHDISQTGEFFVGELIGDGGGSSEAYVWEGETGVTLLGYLADGDSSSAQAVNSDGTVIVGWSIIDVDNTEHAFRWTSSGMVDIDPELGEMSAAYGVNHDGSIVVGVYATTGVEVKAFLWDAVSGVTDLGTIDDMEAVATHVNFDGSVVTGTLRDPSEDTYRAFRWTPSTGMVDIGTLGGDVTVMYGMSNSGEILTGVSNGKPVYYREEVGIIELPTLGGSYGAGMAASDDGTVVGASSDGVTTVACRWVLDQVVSTITSLTTVPNDRYDFTQSPI